MPDIPWAVHRIITSQYYRGTSLMEVQREWSVDDALDAHQALDYFTHVEWLQMKTMRQK